MPTSKKQQQQVDLRSGHIKITASATPSAFQIIGRPGDFRILNTGDQDFTITGAGLGTSSLRSKASVDVRAISEVFITTGVNQAAKGIYESIDIPMPVRHGRYKGPGGGQLPTLARQLAEDGYYRILNAARPNGNGFKVFIDGSALRSGNLDENNLPIDFKLPARISVDVFAAGTLAIRNAGQQIACIYEALNESKPIPSGRFSVTINDTKLQKIIDLSGAGTTAYYRLFNSGAEPLKLLKGPAATPVVLATLQEEQSFDFQVAGGNKNIFVNSASGEKLIEGIYEFLGYEIE